ncbi:MAG: TIGR02206 family membrane protein, partial [Chthoniobacterales bacterium]
VGNYIVYLLFIRRWGDLTWEATLPMQMCDWAMVVIVVTLLTARPRWFEVAYFWGIGGTLQAVLTPNLRYGFPDLRFVSFFIAHSGIIVGVLFLILACRLRPYPISIVRAFVWSEVYFVAALAVDYLTGVNYGFLLHKPEAFSLLSLLSDSRPLYLLQMHGLALLFFGLLYLPFVAYDGLVRARGHLI